MNILVPDRWLRDFLDSPATPEQIKEYLSLCGPSVERINYLNKEVVYEIEVTSNRPDSLSIFGIAREAAAILPRFGISATLTINPYRLDLKPLIKKYSYVKSKKLTIETDPKLNPRWTSIVLGNVKVYESPKWLQQLLNLTGIRPLNNIIDITNYLMRAFGQPAHAFDFDRIQPKPKKRIPFMKLRLSKTGEQLTTLDSKTHTLLGGDIVIEDGKGRLIDLCGIMGAENSGIQPTTKNVVLFLQTYNPINIRRTAMSLAIRTEAASLFEKGLDPELVLPAIVKGIELIEKLAGGKVISPLYDLYPKPSSPYTVTTPKTKITTYLGKTLSDSEINAFLTPLGFTTKTTPREIKVGVPSFRRDIEIPEDIIEEIARIYGYHNISNRLPDTEPPIAYMDSIIKWEEEVKVRLRDWGYTEVYTYSMISEKLMDLFNLDKQKAYKISNPLSKEWVYMQPHLFPSVLACVKQNLNERSDLRLFELSMAYQYRENNLPLEKPTLIVVWSGEKYLEAKGLAETIFDIFGINFPQADQDKNNNSLKIYNNKSLSLGIYGSLGEIDATVLNNMEIKAPVTRLYLDFGKLVKNANPIKKYHPIPKYPSVIEDLTFILPEQTPVGLVMEEVKNISPVITQVELIDRYQNSASFRIYYQQHNQQVTASEVKKLREQIISRIKNKFSGQLKGQTDS